jgi:hypothetical protein
VSSRREAEFDPTTDPLLAVLSEAARQTAADAAGPGPTPAVWHRLQALRARPPGRPRGRLFVLSVGAMAAALALVVGVRAIRQPRPLTYVVGQGAAEQDGYIRGVGEAATEVRFSDGTRIHLQRGARLSVLSRGSEGARLRVEDGEAHFEVVHRPKAAWSVEAGPYVVYVTGTSFDVRWSGSEETMEVVLRSGSVRVGGPFLPERVTLRPGQRLTARLASGELRIDEDRKGAPALGLAVPGAEAPSVPSLTPEPPALTPEPPALTPEPPALAPEPAALATEPAALPTAHGPGATARIAMPHRVKARPLAMAATDFLPGTWPAEVAAGGAATVVAEAEAHGVEETLAEVSGGALAALADAARYSGRRELAVRVLNAERARFPGTPPAQVAAFLLGRLADDRGDTPVALDWYRRYLAEAPRGPYAPDALGRAMLTVERLSGRAAAHDIAAEYVRRFPNGTYLLQAHSILANP